MKKNLMMAAMVIGLFILLAAPAYADQLTITSITPNAGYNNTSVFITNLQGTNFTINTQVFLVKGVTTIGTTGPMSITPTQIQCTFNLTGNPAGPYNVTVDESGNASNNATLPNGFTVFAPPPALLTITPQTGSNDVSLPPLSVVLNGTGLLVPGSVVNLSRLSTNITAAGLTLNPNGTVSGTFNLAGAANGTWSVTWMNYDGNVSNGLPFTITNPPPGISNVTPATGINTNPNQGIVINGSNFITGASASFTKGITTIPFANSPSVINPGQINAGLNLVGMPVGPYDLTITNPDSENVTLVTAFRVLYPAAPAVTGIVPNTGNNGGPVTVNISGSDFQPGLSANLTRPSHANITGTINSVNPGLINCTFPILGQDTGLWNVVVVNNDSQSSNTNIQFNITNPKPVVTSITPANGSNTNPALSVQIVGTGFIDSLTIPVVALTKGSEVIYGQNVVVADGTHIGCLLNLTGHTAQSYNVTVMNTADGQTSDPLVDGFLVTQLAPTVTGINPQTGQNDANTTATMSGTGFVSPVVLMNMTGQLNRTAIISTYNTTTISCMLPTLNATTGSWKIIVINNDGQTAANQPVFNVTSPAPVVSDIFPYHGTNTGSLHITNISGSNFQPGASVTFTKTGYSPLPISPDGYISSTQVACFVDLTNAQVGQWNVTVTNPDGQSATLDSAKGFFVFYPDNPGNLAISPVSGPNTSPVSTLITGTGFHPGLLANLTLGNTTVTGTVSNITGTSFNSTFDITGKPAGIYDLLVKNNDSQTAPESNAFTVFSVGPNLPVPDFTATPTAGFAPLFVQFNDTSVTNITSWNWDLDTSSHINASAQNPSFTYTLPGSYNVSLMVTNASGTATTVKSNFIVVTNKPVANFTGTPLTGLIPLTVNFTDLSSADSTSWHWDFGDGSNSTVQNPSHVYTAPGTFNVSLVTDNAGGYSDPLVKYAYVTAASPIPPVANFTIVPDFGFAPLIVNFTDNSVTNITSWNWDFGDSTSSNLQNPPPHLYSGAQNYTVTLTVQNISGSSSATKNVTITNKPVANFTADRTSGNIPLFVNFTDHSTDATAWSWDFGDGTNSTLQNPGHLYNATGQFSVTLTPSNAGGSGDPLTKNNYITVHVQPPAADFTGTPLSGDKPLPVQFNDTSAGNPTQWNWNFGDGNTSTLQNPAHTYGTVGIYNVTLEAINDGGNSIKEKDDYINVTQPRPIAGFGVNRTSGTIPFDVSFVDQSMNDPTGWNWNFGDGSNSTVQNPVHRYSTAGNFTVTMKASNSGGISNNTAFITINALMPPPVANFTGTPTIGTLPLTVQFNDTSSNSPRAWVWDFGDGEFANIKNPVHTYNKVGSFNVTLVVVNTGGSSSLTRPAYITVTRSPFADFTANPTSGISPLLVRFTDQSSGKPFLYYWTFGDGLVSTDKNPVHVYQKPGNYTVTETVQNFFGTSKKIKENFIVISAKPAASFTANPAAGLSPLDVQFVDTSTGNPTQWSWNFGDGTTSTQENPLHTYTAGGVYSVKLTVTNSVGSDSVTKTQEVSVSTPINADFTYKPAEGNVPLTVVFTDTSTGNPFSYTWNFGDNIISNDHNPVHTYLKSGVYNVTLNVLSTQGSGKVTKQVTVTHIPVAHFKAVPLNGSAPLTVQFTDTSANGPMSEWFWTFGDGQFSQDQNPSHTFNTPGQYSVTLHVTNEDGSDELVQHNLITVKPFP
ncbi:MAG TPA: PKD domain-containing protein [Methanoregulaceae archaeon]|nr:PKD domain-containing protein [Methanoregulaceae archaeon]